MSFQAMHVHPGSTFALPHAQSGTGGCQREHCKPDEETMDEHRLLLTTLLRQRSGGWSGRNKPRRASGKQAMQQVQMRTNQRMQQPAKTHSSCPNIQDCTLQCPHKEAENHALTTQLGKGQSLDRTAYDMMCTPVAFIAFIVEPGWTARLYQLGGSTCGIWRTAPCSNHELSYIFVSISTWCVACAPDQLDHYCLQFKFKVE